MIKNANSNMGNGIEMVRDIAAYKNNLLSKKDKWGNTFVAQEPVKEL